MPRTFLQLKTEILADEFDGSKYGDFVEQWINEAVQTIGREVRLPQAFTSVTFTQAAGTATYTLPAGLETLESVVIGGKELGEVDQIVVDTAYATSGVPSIFALYGNTLTFWPTPALATSVTIRYQGTLSDVSSTADGATLDFPDDFFPLIINYARAKAFAMEDDFEAAQIHRTWWAEGLARMRSQVQTRTRGRVRQIQGQMPTATSPRFIRP